MKNLLQKSTLLFVLLLLLTPMTASAQSWVGGGGDIPEVSTLQNMLHVGLVPILVMVSIFAIMILAYGVFQLKK